MSVEQVRAVIAKYESCWNTKRFRDLRALWADDETMPIWLPEEVERPLTTWADVDAYLTASETLIDAFSIRTWGHQFKTIDAHVIGAVWSMHWNATVWYGNPPRTRAIAGDVSVSAVFKEVVLGDWRFVQYHESAFAPLPFIRRVYERVVDEDFRAQNPIKSAS